jgi:hypothetical protein
MAARKAGSSGAILGKIDAIWGESGPNRAHASISAEKMTLR